VIAQLKTDAELVLYHHRGLLTYAACQYIASWQRYRRTDVIPVGFPEYCVTCHTWYSAHMLWVLGSVGSRSWGMFRPQEILLQKHPCRETWGICYLVCPMSSSSFWGERH